MFVFLRDSSNCQDTDVFLQTILLQMLSRDCTTEIRSLVKESHLDIDMDPVLMHKCTQEVGIFTLYHLQMLTDNF